ncbi:hypothetical protein OQA88_3937 [Cercophora sp. LCS_1]
MRERRSTWRSLAAALPLLLDTTTAHTWPEKTYRIAPNGTMAGEPGFERSHAVRGGPLAENEIVWLIPPNGRANAVFPDDKIVRPGQRALNEQSYSKEFPMLTAAPGDYVAILYTENGHVSKAESANPTKPVNRGTVYLYGTTENDLTNMNLVDIHYVWTADGTGGDGKGRLLATRNYDDGQCHEAIPASGDEEGISSYRTKVLKESMEADVANGLTCQTDVQIPFDVPVNKTLSIIWVWDWPDMNVQGVAVPPASFHANSSDSGEPYITKFETYTGVLDYKIVDPCDQSLGGLKGAGCGGPKNGGQVRNAVKFAKQRNPALAAIKAQMDKPFLVEVPQAGMKVPSATADPADIPMGNLIGVSKPRFPLAPSFFPSINPGGAPAPQPTDEPKHDLPAPGPPILPTKAPAPVPLPSAIPDVDRIRTVTVTVPETTVYVTYTTTPGSKPTTFISIPLGTGNIASSSPTNTESFVRATHSVTRPRRVRREAGGWGFFAR